MIFKKKKNIPEPPTFAPEIEEIKKGAELLKKERAPAFPELPQFKKEEKEEKEEREGAAKEIKKKEIFIKVDKFRELVESLKIIKEKANELEAKLKKLSDLAQKETEMIKEWKNNMEEVKKRIAFVEKNLRD